MSLLVGVVGGGDVAEMWSCMITMVVRYCNNVGYLFIEHESFYRFYAVDY